MNPPSQSFAIVFAAVTLAVGGCSDDSGDGSGEPGGAGGVAGTAGASAASGTAGAGGRMGSGGTVGSGGTAATGGAMGGASGANGGNGGNGGRGGAAGSSSGGANGGAAGSGGTAGAAGSGVTTMGPRFIGRFTNDQRFSWSGATIALRFTGTSISVTLDDSGDNFFDAVVDDGEPRVLDMASGERTYEIATGLSNGPHEVRVSRRTEAFFNPTRFVSFSVPESSWLASTAPERRIEVIGDSISAGYGNEGPNENCPFEAETENHSLTYEAVAAKELGADLHTEAWSGIGVYRNNTGDMNDLMPERFPLIIPTEPGTNWDFSKFQPHAVIVNLGTNDFAPGDPGMGFQTAQEEFAATLRGHYPNAHIYLAVGSMLGGDQYAAALEYLENAVQARRADGDDAIDTLEFATQSASDGLGCDYHPNEVTHARMAMVLVARLRADLGW